MLVNQYHNLKGTIIFTNPLICISSRSQVIFNNDLFFVTKFKQLLSLTIFGITSRISSWILYQMNLITTYLVPVNSAVITKTVHVFISSLGIIFSTYL
jgi:hypothetical protein